MKKYPAVFRVFLLNNISYFLTYRASFWSGLIATLSWSFLSYLSLLVFTYQAPIIAGWQKGELLILIGTFAVVSGIFFTLYQSFVEFSRLIRTGDLDLILFKPLDLQFLVSFQYLSYHNIFRFLFGILMIYLGAKEAGISLNFLSVIAYLLLIITAVIILYNLWFFTISLNFWFIKLDNLPPFLLGIMDVMKLPSDVYRAISDYLFFFLLPFTLMVTTPTKVFLERLGFFEALLAISFAFFSTILTRSFWLFALKRYNSASS